VNTRKVTDGVELCFVAVLIYNCICWGKLVGFDAKLCGLLGLAYVANGWITSRSTFAFYGVYDFCSDLLLLILFCWAPVLLQRAASDGRYDSTFWLVIASVEVTFIVWNLLTKSRAPEECAKRTLNIWTSVSVFSVGLAILGYRLTSSETGLTVFRGATIGLWLWFMGLIIMWNRTRARLNERQGVSFFSD